LTKEPKLVRARQIPEWDTYDREIAAFAKRIEGTTGKGMAASVDALAGDTKEVELPRDEDLQATPESKGRIEDEL
jgi:UDP-glucose:glycoprotein glucosyltransferase